MANAVDAWSCEPQPSFSPRTGRLRTRLGYGDPGAAADDDDPEAEADEADDDEEDGDWRLVRDWTACPIGYVMY